MRIAAGRRSCPESLRKHLTRAANPPIDWPVVIEIRPIVKKLLKSLIVFLLGAAAGAGGYYGWQVYLPETGLVAPAAPPIPLGPSPLEAMPYGMTVAKSTFETRPVFCIELPERKTDTTQVCKVSPGFYATYVNNLLHSVEWDVAAGARFQNEWRKVGLSTNQSGMEFMTVAHRLGAHKVRFEERTDQQIVLTFDVGDISYRLWLQAGTPPTDKSTPDKDNAKGKAKAASDAEDNAGTPNTAKLDIPAHFVVTRLATILSFE